MPLCRATYIYFLYTSEQLWVKGFAQGPNIGSMAVLGLDLMTFQSVDRCLIYSQLSGQALGVIHPKTVGTPVLHRVHC